MSWNYRLCREMQECAPGEYEPSLDIREVYYNEDGSIYAISSTAVPVYSCENDVNSIIDILGKMSSAVSKDVIDLDTVVYVAMDDC